MTRSSRHNSGLGLLSRNWFLSSGTHETSALKLDGMKGYIVQSRMHRSSVVMAIDAAGGVTLANADQVSSAVAQFEAVAAQAQQLINKAAADLASDNDLPSDPAPPSVSVDSWNLAWYIDLDAMTAMLSRLDEVRIASSDAVDRILSAAKNVQIQQAQAAGTPPPPPMPVGTPAAAIDWTGATVNMENALGLTKLGKLAPSLSFGLGLGAVAIIGLAALLFLASRRAA